MAIEGLVNTRDLGGLPLRNGGETPYGVFFRGENVDHLSPHAWEELQRLGIRTVVDLRRVDERESDTGSRPAWITTVSVDLDALEQEAFWARYWHNKLVYTALYYLPYLQEIPQRAAMALEAIASAEPGGVLFHCMAGRDRTGMVAMLLLAAANVEPEAIVDDYMESVRRGEIRALARGTANDEPWIEDFCKSLGTSTEGAFRSAISGLDLDAMLDHSVTSIDTRVAIRTWRGTIA